MAQEVNQDPQIDQPFKEKFIKGDKVDIQSHNIDDLVGPPHLSRLVNACYSQTGIVITTYSRTAKAECNNQKCNYTETVKI